VGGPESRECFDAGSFYHAVIDAVEGGIGLWMIGSLARRLSPRPFPNTLILRISFDGLLRRYDKSQFCRFFLTRLKPSFSMPVATIYFSGGIPCSHPNLSSRAELPSL
jgi:hypothetical protein